MSTPEVTVHNFPPDFPPDTEYLHAALAEWNYRERTKRGLLRLAYSELDVKQTMQVLGRARELKHEAKEARELEALARRS